MVIRTLGINRAVSSAKYEASWFPLAPAAISQIVAGVFLYATKRAMIASRAKASTPKAFSR